VNLFSSSSSTRRRKAGLYFYIAKKPQDGTAARLCYKKYTVRWARPTLDEDG